MEDDAVSIAFRQSCLRNEEFAALGEGEFCFGRRSFRGGCDDLLRGGLCLEILREQSDADFSIRLDEEFGVAAFDFDNTTAIRSGGGLTVIMAIGGMQKRSGEQGRREECCEVFHGVLVFRVNGDGAHTVRGRELEEFEVESIAPDLQYSFVARFQGAEPFPVGLDQ